MGVRGLDRRGNGMRACKALLAIVEAVVCVAAIPSVALANRAIGIEPAGMVRKFTMPEAPMVITDSNGVVITCDVVYTEGWERRIPKVVNTAVAGITEGRAENCVGQNGLVKVDGVILQLGMVTPKYYQSYTG